nr:tRNA lysidine(34) synthetase TilS [Roseovarius azorensis]
MPGWQEVAEHFAPDAPEALGVAVSGGGDSLALLLLLNDWRLAGGPRLRVVTVDHGLRPEAAVEAAGVARICASLGLAHETLNWAGWDGQGNLSDQARRARYGLMAEWARAQGLRDIALGHTLDDQAETFLMRLARGAGVDGLSAMRARWRRHGVSFHRPVLGHSRAALRAVLVARGQRWIDDPTNDDPAYTRVQARRALAALDPLGLTAETLAGVARQLADVRRTLYGYAHAAARAHVRVHAGDLLIARTGLAALPDEVARRLLQAALLWINGADYGPRGQAMTQMLEAARSGEVMTLQGCLMRVDGDDLRLTREYNAVAGLRVPMGAIWDGRWQATGHDTEGVEIAALGAAGLRACPDWRAGGLPHVSAMACPGIWWGDELLAAPLLGRANGWTLRLIRGEEELRTALLSH